MVLNHIVTKSVALCLVGLAAGCATTDSDATLARPTPVVEQPPSRRAAEQPVNAVDIALARDASNANATAAGPATAPVAINPTAPLTYTVKRGDTLWGIASLFLRDPWLWPEIWHVNPTIANPHLIYPGDQVALAYGADGRPQLQLIRGDAVRVSPAVRSDALDGPIANIPYKDIQAFLGRPGIVGNEDLRSAPYVVGMRDRHIAAGQDMQVYVKGLPQGSAGRYSIVHPGEALHDPDTGDLLGYMALATATAQVTPAAGSDLSNAVLLESLRETLRGDLVFPEDASRLAADITPRRAPEGIDGQIIGIVNGVQLVGAYNVVAINRGSRDGLTVGHVLALHQRGEKVSDPGCERQRGKMCTSRSDVQLPDERTGTLLVFKTYDRMSFGLVTGATSEMRVADGVRTP